MPATSTHASLDALQRHIGERIQAARLAAGLTQEAAADIAGIDVKRWQRLEAGQVNATVKTLWRVAEATGVEVFALVGVGPETPADPCNQIRVDGDATTAPSPDPARPDGEV
jgi:transcriptional regulator with XRE-family HTH domain